ncbi:MAG: hypothetical protein E4H37_00480 [Gemmatimonadales bacterium]|nr:MAG: hypothetical protein E4H37_00480 [Gemmatimonadales bacterium]
MTLILVADDAAPGWTSEGFIARRMPHAAPMRCTSKEDAGWMRSTDDHLQMVLFQAGTLVFAPELHPGATNARVSAIRPQLEQHGVSR